MSVLFRILFCVWVCIIFFVHVCVCVGWSEKWVQFVQLKIPRPPAYPCLMFRQIPPFNLPIFFIITHFPDILLFFFSMCVCVFVGWSQKWVQFVELKIPLPPVYPVSYVPPTSPSNLPICYYHDSFLWQLILFNQKKRKRKRKRTHYIHPVT